MSVEENSYVPSDIEHLSRSEDEETVDIHGFRVHVSKENKVKEIFKDHPDLSLNFKLENQKLKNAFMDVLLDVIEKLYDSTNVLSWKDIIKVGKSLLDLTRVGFKVRWLSLRFDETYSKKEKQIITGARIEELDKLVKKQKLNLSYLDAAAEAEAEAVALAEAEEKDATKAETAVEVEEKATTIKS